MTCWIWFCHAAAPEFFLGVRYDQGVDMWACGVLMYMMYGTTSLPPDLLCDVVKKCFCCVFVFRLTLRAPFGNEDNDEKDQVEQIRRINNAEYHFLFKIWETRSEEGEHLCSFLFFFFRS